MSQGRGLAVRSDVAHARHGVARSFDGRRDASRREGVFARLRRRAIDARHRRVRIGDDDVETREKRSGHRLGRASRKDGRVVHEISAHAAVGELADAEPEFERRLVEPNRGDILRPSGGGGGGGVCVGVCVCVRPCPGPGPGPDPGPDPGPLLGVSSKRDEAETRAEERVPAPGAPGRVESLDDAEEGHVRVLKRGSTRVSRARRESIETLPRRRPTPHGKERRETPDRLRRAKTRGAAKIERGSEHQIVHEVRRSVGVDDGFRLATQRERPRGDEGGERGSSASSRGGAKGARGGRRETYLDARARSFRRGRRGWVVVQAQAKRSESLRTVAGQQRFPVLEFGGELGGGLRRLRGGVPEEPVLGGDPRSIERFGVGERERARPGGSFGSYRGVRGAQLARDERQRRRVAHDVMRDEKHGAPPRGVESNRRLGDDVERARTRRHDRRVIHSHVVLRRFVSLRIRDVQIAKRSDARERLFPSRGGG